MAKRETRQENAGRGHEPRAGSSISSVVIDVLRELERIKAADGGWLFAGGVGYLRVRVDGAEVTIAEHTASQAEATPASSAAPLAGREFGRSVAMAEAAPGDLRPGEMVPNRSERDVVGAATTKIVRGTPAFAALVGNRNPAVTFKDEEGTGADRMMTNKLKACIDSLAVLVTAEFPNSKLRVTEAWDENLEHGTNSIHYEARAVDLTTHPIDSAKLGRLGRLAVNAGFEWVFFETNHIHASMSK